MATTVVSEDQDAEQISDLREAGFTHAHIQVLLGSLPLREHIFRMLDARVSKQ